MGAGKARIQILSSLLELFIFLTDAQIPCPGNWTYIHPFCYKYETTILSWAEARFQCQREGAELASIHSEEDNRLISWFFENTESTTFQTSNMRRKQASPTLSLTCFEKHPGFALVGFAEVVVSTMTVEACLMECLSSSRIYNINCRSVLYYSDSHDCILNSQTRFTKPDLFTSDITSSTVDYYDNNCNGKINTGQTSGCFQMFPGMALFGFAEQVLAGLDVQRCQEQCILVECQSIVYFANEQTCILNHETRTSRPALFGPEANAIYYERSEICTNVVPPTSCLNSVMDLFLIVDSSSSIGPESFENIRQFLKNLVSSFNIGPHGVFVGLEQFNEEPKSEFHLKSYQTTMEVLAAIDAMKWMGGHTMIGKALAYALENELTVINGDRMPDVPDVVIVLTDGLSQDNPSLAANTLRASGVLTYAVGITESVLDEQLLVIAGSSDRVYKVRDFSRLDSRLQNQILHDICHPPRPISPEPMPCNPNPYVSCATGQNLGGYMIHEYSAVLMPRYQQNSNFTATLETNNQRARTISTHKKNETVSVPTNPLHLSTLSSLLAHSEDEGSKFTRKPKTKMTSDKTENTGVWLAFTDQFSEGRYLWVDNTEVNYTNWKFGQPDGKAIENCALSLHEPLRRWIDASCSSRNSYVCKKSISKQKEKSVV